MFRSLPWSNIQQSFGVDTKSFGDSHLSAVQYTVTTKEYIELIQGLMLAGLFFVSAIFVNDGTLSTGAAVGIIQAFISGSRDVVDFSHIMIQMKFHSEGPRD